MRFYYYGGKPVPSQEALVKHILIDERKALSSIKAIDKYRITRLAAIVFNLRQDGFDIVTIRKERRDIDGKLVTWWAEYRLAA